MLAVRQLNLKAFTAADQEQPIALSLGDTSKPDLAAIAPPTAYEIDEGNVCREGTAIDF
jgi:hypothetical protein